MPDTKYISKAQHTRAGGVSPAETDRRARQGEGSHSSIAQARQTQTQAKMMQRWEHQTAASTFTVPIAALLCLPWLWVAVKHLTRRGANSGAAVAWGKCKRGNRRPWDGDRRNGQPLQCSWRWCSRQEVRGSHLRWIGNGMGRRDHAGPRRASSDRPGPHEAVMAHLPWAETAEDSMGGARE